MVRKNTTVQMRHPKTHGTYEAPKSAVEFWQGKGWERVSGTDTSKTKTATAPAEEKKGGTR